MREISWNSNFGNTSTPTTATQSQNNSQIFQKKKGCPGIFFHTKRKLGELNKNYLCVCVYMVKEKEIKCKSTLPVYY